MTPVHHMLRLYSECIFWDLTKGGWTTFVEWDFDLTARPSPAHSVTVTGKLEHLDYSQNKVDRCVQDQHWTEGWDVCFFLNPFYGEQQHVHFRVWGSKQRFLWAFLSISGVLPVHLFHLNYQGHKKALFGVPAIFLPFIWSSLMFLGSSIMVLREANLFCFPFIYYSYIIAALHFLSQAQGGSEHI